MTRKKHPISEIKDEIGWENEETLTNSAKKSTFYFNFIFNLIFSFKVGGEMYVSLGLYPHLHIYKSRGVRNGGVPSLWQN